MVTAAKYAAAKETDHYLHLTTMVRGAEHTLPNLEEHKQPHFHSDPLNHAGKAEFCSE